MGSTKAGMSMSHSLIYCPTASPQPLVSCQAPPPEGCEHSACICFVCKGTPAWTRASSPQVHQLAKALLLSSPYTNSKLGFIFCQLMSLEKAEGPLRRG